MPPTHCPNCNKEMLGAMTCSSCGWQAPVQTTRLKSDFMHLLVFWGMMLGACGGCGYLAYAGSGLIFGFGPFYENAWIRAIAIGLVVLYVLASILKQTRRRG